MTTRRIIQLLNGLALLIGILWLIFKPDFEPALTSIALLATLISLIVEEKVSSSHALDRELFLKLKDVLPSSGSIEFIDRNNFAGFPFERSALNDLRKFVYEWDDAEHEFLGKDLEKKRKKLLQLANEYLVLIARNTFPMDHPELSTVPPNWEIDCPEIFNEVVGKLHNLAGEIVETHQDLFRSARKKLKC